METLRLAIQQQDRGLAAHILVYPAVRVKRDTMKDRRNGQERRTQGKPERP